MSPAAAPAISVRDLRKIYPSGVAVDGISFEVPAGRVVGLLGGNGAEPDLLLLDEPTASLDPDTADWIRTRLERYRIERGASLLLASHNMGEVERLCDRVIMLKAGRIVDEGAPEALLERYGRDNLEEVFLDVARGRGRAAELAQ